MAIIKALVGGLIGGGIGAYASSMVHEAMRTSSPWGLLLAGLFAGLGVRLVCGKDRSFLTGVISSVAAILAIVGTSYINSMAIIRGRGHGTSAHRSAGIGGRIGRGSSR